MRLLRHTDAAIRTIDAIVAHANYLTGKLWAVADEGYREFILSDCCRLHFNGRRIPFRCFHPLDRVQIRYVDYGPVLIAESLSLVWAEDPVASQSPRYGGGCGRDVA